MTTKATMMIQGMIKLAVIMLMEKGDTVMVMAAVDSVIVVVDAVMVVVDTVMMVVDTAMILVDTTQTRTYFGVGYNPKRQLMSLLTLDNLQ
mmetsp:Transcript_18733/g.31393  ORF Transcript_18733/g.31393 Transcript_18733/m.31393 type:complete len:91 (+) Transcript_18733:40-312(+)